MKIKRWLIISYILVILSPILTGSILYNWIKTYNREIQLKDYLENMQNFGEYEKLLDDPKLYTNYSGEYNLISDEEKNYIEIKLYDNQGYNLYSSGIGSMNFKENREILYKDLYQIKRGYKADTFKKPVFKNGEIVGVYEIILARSDLIRGVNIRSILAMVLFGTHFIIVIFIVAKMINKKINNPLNLLIDSMKKFALGENVDVEYSSKDEIGELITQFNLMKEEIEEKNLSLKKEKESKEYMISAISHDLKTPLTSIRAYTEILKDNRDKEDTNRYEDIIISKCDYMKDMLEDLYLYTLLNSDYNMDFVKVEGEEFFQMLLSGYREVSIKNNLNYKEDIKVKGEYSVDVKSMIRVMDNLFSNALRYSKSGGDIWIGVFSKEYKLPYYLDKDIKTQIDKFREKETIIIFKNTGSAIPKSQIENIFNPFYKADNSRNNSKKTGTGLGLSIVKNIIDRHNGKIKAISKDNSTFIIYTLKREDDIDV